MQRDVVIVTPASSSVGIAFQVARAVGATVIATTRTSAKRQALLDNGAHHVIATEEEDLVTRVMEITAMAGDIAALRKYVGFAGCGGTPQTLT